MSMLIQSVYENLTFLLTVLAIFAALVGLAAAAERTLGRKGRKPRGTTRYLTVGAMCAALSGLLMLLELPLFFAPSFYKIDLSEVPVLFCGFYLGPVAGVVCEFLKVLLKLLLKGTTTAFVGEFANFAVGCAMVLPAAILYRCKRTRGGAIAALAVGSLSMTVFGSLLNALYLLPRFAALFGMPMDAIIAMGSTINPAIHSVSTLVLFAVVPLNLLKGLVDSVLTFALYKRIAAALGTK